MSWCDVTGRGARWSAIAAGGYSAVTSASLAERADGSTDVASLCKVTCFVRAVLRASWGSGHGEFAPFAFECEERPGADGLRVEVTACCENVPQRGAERGVVQRAAVLHA